MAIPVYIFAGFLESGKSTLIKETLADPNFNDGEKTLLIVCEEGSIEYDSNELKEMNTDCIVVENESELTNEFFKQCDLKYACDRVMIEFNGTWKLSEFIAKEFPIDWLLLQVLTTVNAQTFATYMNNMRSIFYDHLSVCEVVIFNRCDETHRKSFLRSNIKAINKGAQIIYEDIDGRINELKDDELPFDVSAARLDIQPDDYGLWYMDALENPNKYEGKTVTFKGMIMRRENDPLNTYVIGRVAMVCCSDDTQLIGYMCQSSDAEGMLDGDWIELTAKMNTIYDDEYEGEVPLLKEISYQRIPPIKNDLVYFS